MALLNEPSLKPKGLGGSKTQKLLEIKEKSSPTDRLMNPTTNTSTPTASVQLLHSSTSSTPTASVKLLRGIHISELYGTTINPDPRGGVEALVDKKLNASSSSSSSTSSMRGSKQQRQREISASAAKSEYVVDKEVVVTEHLTENLMRQLTGCSDLRLARCFGETSALIENC